MRKGKLANQQKKKVISHTPTERLALRRKKRKKGPSALRRKESRKAKQEAHALVWIRRSEQ